jgi:hypothetical protein
MERLAAALDRLLAPRLIVEDGAHLPDERLFGGAGEERAGFGHDFV